MKPCEGCGKRDAMDGEHLCSDCFQVFEKEYAEWSASQAMQGRMQE